MRIESERERERKRKRERERERERDRERERQEAIVERIQDCVGVIIKSTNNRIHSLFDPFRLLM